MPGRSAQTKVKTQWLRGSRGASGIVTLLGYCSRMLPDALLALAPLDWSTVSAFRSALGAHIGA